MKDKQSAHICHLYGRISGEQELTDNLVAIVNEFEDDGEQVVVYIDNPLDWLPDGALVVLPNEKCVHLCTICEWPTAPLARPYASISIALNAAREAIVKASASIDEAVDIAMQMILWYTGRPESVNPTLRELMWHDIACWMEVLESTVE